MIDGPGRFESDPNRLHVHGNAPGAVLVERQLFFG